MKYTVCITEILQRTVTVIAENEEMAYDKVCHSYKNNELVLDANDFIKVNIEVEQ